MRTAEATQLATLHRDPLLVEDAFAIHYSAVFRQVQRLMRDPDDSYDLTLTAWEKAQRAWDRRPLVALEIKPWLFRTIRNKCIDVIRQRRSVSITAPVTYAEGTDASTLEAQLVDHDPLPDEMVERAPDPASGAFRVPSPQA